MRDVDRRVAARAWKRVRTPAMPAWVWLAIDLFVGGLLTALAGAFVGLANEDAGQVASLVAMAAVLVVAVMNFVRTTRPEPSDEEPTGR